ncbi:hypothetical protein [Chryseobacterium sp. LAM-KRS1]|uniref:hypothetical protein n=1 Tax=Chryseobacterium sp. LAM-KRS1 TaxID=2715754 RepID=UPI001555229B|nr:hypothetical protein [Chryseobacterium sp. LAM-KRS1]
MKKFLLILLASTVSFVAICFAVFYSYKSFVLEKLRQKDNHIKEVWSSLYKESLERTLVIENLINISNCDRSSIDSTIVKNKSNRDPNKVEELWNLEYTTNKAYIQLGKCFEGKSNTKIKTDSLKLNAEKLNRIVDEYNANVLDFNKYYSIFPNFMFGSQEGFRRKKFFYLKYGEDNEEYYKQKKKTDKWIETGKWE